MLRSPLQFKRHSNVKFNTYLVCQYLVLIIFRYLKTLSQLNLYEVLRASILRWKNRSPLLIRGKKRDYKKQLGTIKRLPISLLSKNQLLYEGTCAQGKDLDGVNNFIMRGYKTIAYGISKNYKELTLSRKRLKKHLGMLNTVKKKYGVFATRNELLGKGCLKSDVSDKVVTQEHSNIKNVILARINGRDIISNNIRQCLSQSKREVDAVKRLRQVANEITVSKQIVTRIKRKIRCITTTNNYAKNIHEPEITCRSIADTNELSSDSCETVIVHNCDNDYSLMCESINKTFS